MTPVATVAMATVRWVTKPQWARIIPHRLLVNHDGLGLGLGFHEHPPKGEHEGDDRDD
jgi:hypothetical protein